MVALSLRTARSPASFDVDDKNCGLAIRERFCQRPWTNDPILQCVVLFRALPEGRGRVQSQTKRC